MEQEYYTNIFYFDHLNKIGGVLWRFKTNTKTKKIYKSNKIYRPKYKM